MAGGQCGKGESGRGGQLRGPEHRSPGRSATADMTPVLEASDITKRYGSLTVLHEVSLAVEAGEAVGLVGPNGAGKTTLLDVIAGAQRGEGGRVLLCGADVTHLPPARRARRGMARSFQMPRPLGDLTVFETAMVAATRGGGLRGRAAQDAALDA